jgi:hypothetical protein
MARDPWYYYGRELHDYDTALDQLDYAGIAPKLPEPQRRTQGFFTFLEGGDDGSLTPERIKRLLSESTVGPPHGFDLLTPSPLPTFRDFQSPLKPRLQYKNPSLAFRYLGRPGVLPSMKQMRELYRRKRGCERKLRMYVIGSSKSTKQPKLILMHCGLDVWPVTTRLSDC